MSNNKPSNSDVGKEGAALSDTKGIVTNESSINYDEAKHEDKSQILATIIQYEFFISHASISKDTQKDERAPLPGEEDFVRALVRRLENYKPHSTYADFKDNPNLDFGTFMRALKSSKYGIFICSPRFIDRFRNSAPFITEEVKQFWTIKSTHHEPDKQIPIIFGVNIVEYDYGPFSSSDFRIDAEYGKLPIEDMAVKVTSEIIRKVGS